MNQVKFDWQDIEDQCRTIAYQLEDDGWKPDYIVGITRGGAIPAVMLSHFLNVPMHPLEVSLRTEGGCQVHDGGMAEDAVGYIPFSERNGTDLVDISRRKNILVVDDINDTGATISWIKNSWESSAGFINWDGVWGNNVRFAVLVNNVSSKETADYSGVTIDKSVDNSWIVFPFESWWNK